MQVPVPEQSPVQPAKPDEQVAPQVIPAGLELTEPDPVPDFETFRVSVFTVKVAVTEWAASIVTMQVPVPEQSPVHPAKSELTSGVAVRVTTVPNAKSFVQVDPQSIPAGLEDTEPEPVPSVATSRVSVLRVNVAVTDRA